MIEIRPYRPDDWPQVWAVLEPVFRAGETYAVDREISEEEARALWTERPLAVYVAVESEKDSDRHQGGVGKVLGTYYLKANQAGGGSHICNCGYAVAVEARGRGLAGRMCAHSLAEAAGRGFRGMQFNLVVSTNRTAVELWKRHGFEIIGTIPGGFSHPVQGLVDAYVMFRVLAE